ncbi:GGDEF domain-containing protein [Helicobacter sp. 23-1045]
MRRSIARQYIHILMFILTAFTIFYLILFYINRTDAIKAELNRKEQMISTHISRTANIAESVNFRQLRYFIDTARLLEHIYKSDKEKLIKFLPKSVMYDFVGIMNNDGKFIYSNNPNLAKIFTFKPHKKTQTIKSTILYDTHTLTTYRILSYPIVTNGAIEGYIVGYLDVNAFIDISDMYLISQDSFVLNNSDINSIYLGNKTFGFLYPKEWEKIQEKNEGQFRTDSALFTYKLLVPEKKVNEFVIETGDLYFLSMMTIDKKDSPYHIDSIRAFIKYVDFKDRISYWIIGYFFITFTSVVMYIIIIGRIKNSLLANTDQLTGAYNRRRGFQLLEKLTHFYSLANKSALNRFFVRGIFFRRFFNSLHICLVDIDNLKKTNDKLGHKFGDELISITIATIKSHIKKDEMIIRIGGDEFLIIFINRNMSDIERIWKAIQSDFDNKNVKGKFPYTISVSKGVIEYRSGANIQDCIIEADALMYKEKKRHKVNLFFD